MGGLSRASVADRLAAAIPAAAFLLVASLAAVGGWRRVDAQEPAPFLKVDLVTPADVTADDRAIRPTELCVYLPEQATTVSVARRPLVSEAGSDRPLWMTIRPYVTTALPLVERVNVMGSLTLTIPELGYETCFSFENRVFPREAQVAQPHKHFAQIVTLEVH